MRKEKEEAEKTMRCLIKILYAPISTEKKVKLLRILRDKGPYCSELKKLFKNKKADTPGVINWLSTPLVRN